MKMDHCTVMNSYLTNLIRMFGIRNIVELGTGDGYSSSCMLMALPLDGTLTTINWPNPPSGDNPLRYLGPFVTDTRLKMLSGDTRDLNIVAQIFDGIDLLFIDSTHTKECAETEWRLYEPKLADLAIVIIDDLNHNDMIDFWNWIPYWKIETLEGQIGIVGYQRGDK